MLNHKSIIQKITLVVCILGLVGCSTMDKQEQRIVSGGAAGAVVGTVGTVMTGGCVACGAAIGGAVGAGAGYVVDKIEKNK